MARPGNTFGAYGPVSIDPHWAVAVLIPVQIGLGWRMHEALPDHSPTQTQVESVHIALGLTFLLMILAWIAVRLTHRGPPSPPSMARWKQALARSPHMLFYL
jgi:cytochrome b561